jgi:polar amino acid transport system substrate-binding protein
MVGMFPFSVSAEETESNGDAFSRMTYLTEEGKPVNYVENGELKGIAVDLLITVLDRFGANVTTDDIVITDWPTAFNRAQNETNKVLFSTKRLPDREKIFKWAGPILSSKISLFAKKDKNILISGPEDLPKYKIGVIKNSASDSILISLGYPENNLLRGSNAEELFSLLSNDSIDIWSTGSESEWYITEKAGDANTYESVYTGESADLYYAFSLDIPDSLVKAFQNELDQIKKEKGDYGFSPYEKILYTYSKPIHQNLTIDKKDVIDLVQKTTLELKEDVSKTIADINAGKSPYLNSDNPDLYVFVYAEDGILVAEADNTLLVGKNLRGKTDVAGTPFRDQMIDNAIKNGTAWVDYIFSKPDTAELYYKSAYGEKVTGSDGKTYVVGAGMYQ